MIWLTNCIFSFLNILLMILGVAALATSGIMRITEYDSDCHKFLETPLLVIGCFLVFISMVGIVGSCCKLKSVLWIYSFMSFSMVLAALGFIAFAFIVTNATAGNVLSGAGYDRYRLGDYSNWLRDHFADANHWRKIKSCMIEADVCDKLDPHQKSLPILQTACCKPPEDCGFVESGNGRWVMPETKLHPSSSANSKNIDCTTWNNDPKKRCFDCESCKGGALDNIRKDWRTLAHINMCLLLLFVVIYSVSCCARRGIQPSTKNYKGSCIGRAFEEVVFLDIVLSFFPLPPRAIVLVTMMAEQLDIRHT
ncbi:TET8 [Linum grandiflorum]